MGKERGRGGEREETGGKDGVGKRRRKGENREGKGERRFFNTGEWNGMEAYTHHNELCWNVDWDSLDILPQ